MKTVSLKYVAAPTCLAGHCSDVARKTHSALAHPTDLFAVNAHYEGEIRKISYDNCSRGHKCELSGGGPAYNHLF
jgi:hypothetical protein